MHAFEAIEHLRDLTIDEPDLQQMALLVLVREEDVVKAKRAGQAAIPRVRFGLVLTSGGQKRPWLVRKDLMVEDQQRPMPGPD